MVKRVGNLISKIADLDNIMSAYCSARRGKRTKADVLAFSKDINNNLLRLHDELISGNISVGKYKYFEIRDPKKRLICAADFSERVLHHSIINICKPYFERHLIYDTYATREGKGIYSAIDKARMSMRKYPYVAKLDVRKYFDSVNHVILKKALERLFKDRQLLNLFNKIIDSYSVTPGCGIPIGNLTSQYFANYYLSILDHYIKEHLRVPVYVRYMDDMLLFGTSHDDVAQYVREVECFVNEKLSLTIKQPQICNSKNGVVFLGYRIYANKILLNRRSKLRFIRRARQYRQNLDTGVWGEQTYFEHIIPLLAFVEKAYTRRFRQSMQYA